MKLNTGYSKPIGSNNYVLLAGGGHKALSEFSTAGLEAVIESKTYEVSSISAAVYMPIFRFLVSDATHLWHIKYKLDVQYLNGTNPTTYNGEYQVEFYGYNRTICSYKIWNSFRSGYPIYYHTFFQNKTDANHLTLGSFFGILFKSISTAVNAYKRVIKVDLIDYYGCKVEFLPEMKNYNSTYNLNISGTATDINISSNIEAANYNATSQGLQETGDSDNTSTLQYLNSFTFINETSPRLNGYGLFGYNSNGEIESFGAYGTNSSTVLRTIDLNDRLINSNGIDYIRGIWYLNGSTNYAQGTRIGSGIIEAALGIDLRYTFNTYYNNTVASPLGIVRDKAVYLRGYLKDNLFYFAPTEVTHGGNLYLRAWTQDIPTEEETIVIEDVSYPVVYWLFGPAYYNSSYVASGYLASLLTNNPLYWFKNGIFSLYGESIPKSLPANGGNSDKVDGFDASDFEGLKLTVIDAKNLDNNTWYPVTTAIKNSIITRFKVLGRTEAPGEWNIRDDKLMALYLDYEVTGNGWGWSPVSRIVKTYCEGEGTGLKNLLCGLGQLTNSSTEYIYVRGGAVYNFYVSDLYATPILRTETYILKGQSVSPTSVKPLSISRDLALTNELIKAIDPIEVDDIELIPTKLSQFTDDIGYLKTSDFNTTPAHSLTTSDLTAIRSISTNADTIDNYHIKVCDSLDIYDSLEKDPFTFYFIKET